MTPINLRTRHSIAPYLAVVMLLQTMGCASQFEQDTQNIRVEVWAGDAMVTAVDCQITADTENIPWVKVNVPLVVKRSDQPLWIGCRSDKYGLAKGLLWPRIDHERGGQVDYRDGNGGLVDYGRQPSAFAYPSWVKLRFGQSLMFDLSDEVKGRLVLAQPNGPTPNQ